MASQSTAWFRDPALRALVRSNTSPVSSWPKGEDKADTPDVREANYHVLETTRPLLPWVFGAIAATHLTNWLAVLSDVHGAGIGLVLLMSGRSVAYALGGIARDVALGGDVSGADTARHVATVFPRVFATTILSLLVVLLGLLCCIVPGFIVLPYVVRAPYEAARGTGVVDAFRKSYRNARVLSAPSTAAANSVFNAVIAVAVWFTALSMLLDIGASKWVAIVAFLVMIVAVEVLLWFDCMGAFLLGDAVQAGAVTPANLGKARLPEKSWFERFNGGNLGATARVVVVLTGFFLVLEAYLSAMMEATRADLPAAGSLAPNFALLDLDGEEHELGDYAGTPTIIYAWAPWCPPCSRQVDELHDFMDEHSDVQVDIVSVALSYGHDQEVRNYVTENELRFAVLFGDDEFSRGYKITSYPTVLLLDADGVVMQTWAGVTEDDELREEIGKRAP